MNEILFTILLISIGCAIGFILAQAIDKRGWKLYDVYTTKWNLSYEDGIKVDKSCRYEIMHKNGVYKVEAYGYDAKFHSAYSTVIGIVNKLNNKK